MYIPEVGRRVKLRLFEKHWAYGVPAWAWLKVLDVNGVLVHVRVLNGDQDTEDTLVVHAKHIDPPIGWRERKPGQFLVEIPPEKADDVRGWFTSGRGMLRWTNKEIGASRGDLLSPGDSDRAPHWAYVGEAFPVKAEDVGVRTETAVPLPLDWFPVCDRCKGTKQVSVASLAEVRNEAPEVTLAMIKSDNRAKLINDEQLECWCCQGTGHTDRHIAVAMRKRYWGREVSNTGKMRAERIARKLEKIHGLAKVHWDYQETGYGLADLRFYTVKIEPLVVPGDTK